MGYLRWVLGVALRDKEQKSEIRKAQDVKQGRRQRGGQWCPPPPFETGVPHFTFGPSVAACIQHCILKMWPRSDF